MARAQVAGELAVEQVSSFLIREKKGKYRVSKGETWIDHFCLFHDDGNTKGASFQPDTKSYACRHGSKYTWDDVLARVGIVHRISKTVDPAEQRKEGQRAAAALLDGLEGRSPTVTNGASSATRVADRISPSTAIPTSSNTPGEPGRSVEGTSVKGQFRPLAEKKASEARPRPDAAPSTLTGVDAAGGPQSETLPLPERTRYTYIFPESGDVSHYIERRDYVDKKEFAWFHADGQTLGKPDEVHPIYGDYRLEPKSYIIVVEGEKCVDAINGVKDSLERPIRAITWANGSGSADKYSVALTHRLVELQPELVIVWPDNDVVGGKAMNFITAQLKNQGIEYVRIKPSEQGWPPKFDAYDYVIEQNGSLAKLVDEARASLPTAGVTDFINRLVVTQNNMIVYPGTRRMWPIKSEFIEALWQREFGKLPRAIQVKDAMAKLFQRAAENPTLTAYRTLAKEGSFYWRPAANGLAFKVSGEGITSEPDPPGTMLLIHPTETLYPTHVDLLGTRQDFINWCDVFRLTPLDIAIVEGWLVCALCGLQTPIMLMRGQAGSGKTTFARALVSIVEPVVFEIDASKDKNRDNREFTRALNMASSVLLDNVSSLPYSMEDSLSRLVTGYVSVLRTLFTDDVEVIRLQKAIVMTTITYDVFKSDLASRIVIASPSISDAGTSYKSDRFMMELMAQMVPKVRGYIFQRCQEFYSKCLQYKNESQPFRVGDIGWVLRTLGYSTDDIAAQESKNKSLKLNQNDPVLDAIVQFWEYEVKGTHWRSIATTALVSRIRAIMYENGINETDLPSPVSKNFARYMEEKRQIFRDFGFDVERIRTAAMRGYHFQGLE